MLYYCTTERNSSQIKSYCRIDGSQFDRFTSHCIRHRLLRKFLSTDGSDDFSYVVTDQGSKTLETAQEIMNALGMSVNLAEGSQEHYS